MIRPPLRAALALCFLLAPVHLALATDPVAARAEIDSLLHDMSAAALAGNQAAYLAHVDPSDAVFLQEQRAWARDLGRQVPQALTLALGEGELTLPDDHSAQGGLTVTWTMAGGKERSVSYPARFVKPEGSWLYAGEAWHVVEGDRCRVLCDEGLEETAALVAEVLPDVRVHVHEGFELTNAPIVDRVQQIKLYKSMSHLQESIYLSYTDGLGGWNEPGEAIKILASGRTGRESLRVLLSHEYGHVATFELGDKASAMPWWALEGVAELSAESYTHRGGPDRIVREWAKAGTLVDWDKLADFRGEARFHYANVYKQGQHMLGYISERFGRTARNRWLTAMAKGSSLDDATREALGEPFADLDAQWRESLKADAKPVDEPPK